MTIERVKELVARINAEPVILDYRCDPDELNDYIAKTGGIKTEVIRDIARLAIELSEEVERLRGKYEKP